MSWSKQYKKSIDCSNLKGFSQKAHCAGRKARQGGKNTKSKSVSEMKLSQLKEQVRNILRERSVKAIQKEYSNVIADMEKHLELYKKSKGTPEEKKHIGHLKTLTQKKKSLQKELDLAVAGLYKNAELKVDESVNEDIEPQTKKIASLTGTRADAVKQFVSANALNITKLLKFIEKGKLSDRMDFVSAIAGKPNNPIQKKIIKMFSESVNEAKTYKKGDKLKIKLKNGKKFDVVFVDYSRTKGIAYGKFKDGGEVVTKPFSLDFIVESVNEGKKVFKVNPQIGKAKYSISSHDGVKKHKDGSDFFDIEIFKNKVDLEKAIKNYTSKGFVKESVNEAELKLGVRYVNNQGKEGFIQTGGSKNPKDWFWYDGKTKHPYDKVKKELKPSKDQKKTGFGDYLKQGGRVWDNVNPTNSPSVNESVNFNGYVSSTDGKTFTLYNSDKKKIKDVSFDDLKNKYMKTYLGQNLKDFKDSFDKTTSKGKYWQYWKGKLVNVKLSNIDESINEATEPEIISQLKDIVKNQQYQSVKDPKSGKKMKVDMQTANAVLQIYNGLSNVNKDNMVKMGLPKMIDVSFKILSKYKK